MSSNTQKLAHPKRAKRTPHAKLIEYLKIVTHLIVKVKTDFRCVKCGKYYQLGDAGLSASHFWQSTRYGTKWLFDNLDPLCWGCHNQVESNKQGWYRDFKLKQLGQQRYDELRKLAETAVYWKDEDLQNMLKGYIMILLKYKRFDVKYENNTLSVFSKDKWKKLFTYEAV